MPDLSEPGWNACWIMNFLNTVSTPSFLPVDLLWQEDIVVVGAVTLPYA